MQGVAGAERNGGSKPQMEGSKQEGEKRLPEEEEEEELSSFPSERTRGSKEKICLCTSDIVLGKTKGKLRELNKGEERKAGITHRGLCHFF